VVGARGALNAMRVLNLGAPKGAQRSTSPAQTAHGESRVAPPAETVCAQDGDREFGSSRLVIDTEGIFTRFLAAFAQVSGC